MAVSMTVRVSICVRVGIAVRVRVNVTVSVRTSFRIGGSLASCVACCLTESLREGGLGCGMLGLGIVLVCVQYLGKYINIHAI